MTLKLGMHTGPQDLEMEELLRLWRRADEAGFHWVSVWDHFYANPLASREDPCFEGVAAMAALAAVTSRVRVGCLVFCALFRTPGLLAKAAVTIDHISQGRAEIGLGAGWFKEEFEDFGYAFPPLGQRLSQMEEAAQIVRSLWREAATSFHGKYYDIEGAVGSPKPINPKMPLWIGGSGEKRTPRMAAQYADGFNMPYLPPKLVKRRLDTLAEGCERFGRDPSEIQTSVNLHFRMGAGGGPEASDQSARANAGALVGGSQQVIDRLGEYAETGIQGVNIALRPPVDWDALETYISEVMPAFHG